MGHKTHPLGFRLGISQDHKSKWYTNLKSYAKFIKEDFQIRKLILDSDSLRDPELKSTGITKILLHRSTNGEKINIVVHTAKPGDLVGVKGYNLNDLDQKLGKLLPTKKTLLDIVEIVEIHLHADLIADLLVIKLEDRVPFRRAMKIILEDVKKEKKIEGIKIQIAGRLNGAEIARTEWLREGRVPLQTLRANIDYSYKTAKTIYGILGIKIWLFKGNVVSQENI